MDIILLTPAQCRAARAILEMSREDLAKAAGIAARTLVDFERGARQPLRNNLAAIRAAMEDRGIVFIGADEVSAGGGAGVRLRDV